MSATSPFDKLYWLRVALGALGGYMANAVFTEHMFSPILDYTDGILLGMIFYFASYYIARFAWYRRLESENVSKLYTTGIGSFVMVFLFTWILSYTLAL